MRVEFTYVNEDILIVDLVGILIGKKKNVVTSTHPNGKKSDKNLDLIKQISIDGEIKYRKEK